MIAIPSEGVLRRPEAYAVRQALVKCVPSLSLMTVIPRIDRTRTGWAITPADRATRDLLLKEEAVSAIRRALGATGRMRSAEMVQLRGPRRP